MLFNSIEFFLFLPIVFILYWFVTKKNLILQNSLLLIASYVFYGWWDWRFLLLIFFSTCVDYALAHYIYKAKGKLRKILLGISLLTNLGLLGIFKYYNFFIDSFINLFASFDITFHPKTLVIILPVGISFYTFQTLSYSLDIYNKKLTPTNHPISFFAFVSFFPQLVAGPIERAKNLLPQFEVERRFNIDDIKDGLRQMLWGLFKKVVIADLCATNVDYIFKNYNQLNGLILTLGAIFFAFQIYCDFSGYSDIAIGTAKLFGFKLMQNFNMPYFSRDIAEFWRRWHISLSTWFRDYLYIPLGGSIGSVGKRIKNIIITFTISGFWHGANWTFIAWGLLNGLLYIPLMLSDNKKKNIDIVAKHSFFPTVNEFYKITTTFLIVCITWIFFRSESITDAFLYLYRIPTTLHSFANSLQILKTIGSSSWQSIIFIAVLLGTEWSQRKKVHTLEISQLKTVIRWVIYYLIIFMLLYFFKSDRPFIYFQF